MTDSVRMARGVAVEEVQSGGRTVLSPIIGGNKRRPLYVPVKNEPGELMMLPKSQLYIDTRYQRRINNRLVSRILANWSWVSCGTLHVSRRREHDNMFFVFDGQHRFRAAQSMPSIRDLPCIVFQLDDVKDEALGFLAANTERRIPTLRDQFNALIMTGDSAALCLEQLVSGHGRIVSAPSSADTVSCVSDCLRLIRDDEEAFRRVFPLIADLCIGRAMIGRIIRGVVYIERHLQKGETLAIDRWEKRFEKIGYDAIVKSIKETTMFEGHGNDAACGAGVVRALNKGLKQPLVLLPNSKAPKAAAPKAAA